MKKLLLTLGSAASVVVPLATVVACGSEDSKEDSNISYNSDTKTLSVMGLDATGTTEDRNTLSETLQKKINVAPYYEATSIEMEITVPVGVDGEDPKEEVFKNTVKISDVVDNSGVIATITTLKEFFEFDWTVIKDNLVDGITDEAIPVVMLMSAIVN